MSWQVLALLVLLFLVLFIALYFVFGPSSCNDKPRQRPWVGNIEAITVQNTDFRRVLHTGEQSQLVVMSVPSGGEIGLEKHDGIDQFIRIESGSGLFSYASRRGGKPTVVPVTANDAMFIPAGTWHNVVASSSTPLKLYTLYAPPAH